MMLLLSEMSPLPLREQIVRRIRQMILSGELPEHFKLPSIRGLATQHRVSVITVQRAYETLERQQMIYARQGKGFYVAPMDATDRAHKAAQRCADALRDPLSEARLMGLSDQEILPIVRDILADLDGDAGEEEDLLEES